MTREKQNIVLDFVKDSRAVLQDNLIDQYLFGSYAKNNQTPDSDIDILLIVRSINPNVRKKISALSSDYSLERGVLISPVIKDLATWGKNKQHNTLFYKEVTQFGEKLA